MVTTISNYESALAYLFGRINYERVPRPRYRKNEFKLSRTRALLERIGNPHRDLWVLHVAGTKGKGSTAAMLAAMLTAAGYRTGLYSSPHLYRLEERMMVDGQAAEPDEVVELVRMLVPAVDELDRDHTVGPTYFEMTTAMALAHFRRRRVDVAVVEVGLGGRLDSTNVCTPEVSIITSISLDHTRQLGDSLESIAREKAGIVKPGIPLVSGVSDDPARGVIEAIGDQRRAPLWQIGREFRYEYDCPDSEQGERQEARGESVESVVEYCLTSSSAVDLDPLHCDATVEVETPHARWPAMTVPLWGRHQGANAAVAVAALDVLRRKGWDISPARAAEGLGALRWPARIEVLARRPTVVVDVAHNVASVQSLVETSRRSFPARRRILVFSTTKDKDVGGMLRVLLPFFEAVVLTRYQNNPRAVAPEQLASAVAALSDVPVICCAAPAEAWQTARRLATPNDLICATGSFFLAAEIREPILADLAADAGAAASRDNEPAAALSRVPMPAAAMGIDRPLQ